MKALLDRFDALESGADRKASRKADHAALATLAARGIDDAERARLRALVKTAESTPDASEPGADEERAAIESSRAAALASLRAWYEEWSEVARVVLKRRDHLIRVGLAKRKGRKQSTIEATPAAPAPVPESNGATHPSATA